MRHLRDIAANAWAQRNWEDILSYIIAAAHRERIPGYWEEAWSPIAMLRKHGYEVLLQYDTVEAVGAPPNDVAGDIVVTVTQTSAVPDGGAAVMQRLTFPQGHTNLRNLLHDLQREFATPGNNHWGDLQDLKALSDFLNIGFFIFADSLQDHGTQCLCGLLQERGNFPYFGVLWWEDPVHFRLGALSRSLGSDYVSMWCVADLPTTWSSLLLFLEKALPRRVLSYH